MPERLERADVPAAIEILNSRVNTLNVGTLIQNFYGDRDEREKREWCPIPHVRLEGDPIGERLAYTVCTAAIWAAKKDPREYWSCAVVASSESVGSGLSSMLATRIYTPNRRLVAGLDFVARDLALAAEEGRYEQVREELPGFLGGWRAEAAVGSYGSLRGGTLAVDGIRELVRWTPFGTVSTKVTDYRKCCERTSELLEFMCALAASEVFAYLDDVFENRSSAWLNFLACLLDSSELRFGDILIELGDEEQWDFLYSPSKFAAKA